MQFTQISGQHIELNGQGFLANYEDWNRDLAMAIAHEDGLDLTECHWTAINFMREFYKTYEIPPSPRVIIKAVGDKLTAGTCTRRTLEALFPKGGCKQACRIAGLPDYYCHSC